MVPRSVVLGVAASLVAAGSLALALVAPRGAFAEGTRVESSLEAEVPVVVELFTSEGCSSCPPADAALGELARARPAAGGQVLLLAFHVDYWDRLGWADPFASAASTERQRGYGYLGGGTYTPQAVIDGQAHEIGSRKAAVERAIASAARRPHLPVRVGARVAKDEVLVDVALPGAPGREVEVVVALTQDEARVEVPRGENAGRALVHTDVVRALGSLGHVRLDRATSATGRLPLPRDLGPAAHVTAWLEARTPDAPRAIVGAARVGLPTRAR